MSDTWVPFFQVDAFADTAYRGNPAAVCLLDQWLPDSQLLTIAAENNLSETAFCVRDEGGGSWSLRWFTPTLEVDLCGHATLAAAEVLFSSTRTDVLLFHTASGELRVRRQGDLLELDFPATPPIAQRTDAPVVAALGAAPRELWEIRAVHGRRYLMAVYDSADNVLAITPNIQALRHLNTNVIVTAPGHDVDFVSRFFAPASGVPEDPVTGSAHCALTPYWAARLNRSQLLARQLSKRGGALRCVLDGDRVRLAGRAIRVIEGRLRLPGEGA